MFNSWGIVNTYGTFLSWYQDHLLTNNGESYDPLLYNLVGSTESFIVLSLSFIVGRLLDANHARQLIALGAVLVTLGMFLLSVVDRHGGMKDGNYGGIWATQGLVVGLGMACLFVSSSQVAATWFVERKAAAIGIVASGASIAGLIYPIMVKFLITEVGFNNAVRYTATVVGFTALISFLLAVPNPDHQYRKPDQWLRWRVWFDPHAFRSAAFCWFTGGVCFLFLGFYAIFFNIEEWAAHNGFGTRDVPSGLDVKLQQEVSQDAIRSFWLLSVMNASSTIGRLGSAWLSDRWGALNIHMASTAVGSLLVLILWTQAFTLGPALAFVIIFGAVSGAIIGLPPASIAYILHHAPPGTLERTTTEDTATSTMLSSSKLGQWTGMMYTAAAIPALIGPVIAGHLVQEYYKNYLTIQLWSGFCLLLSATCMGIGRLYVGRGRGMAATKAWKSRVTQRFGSPESYMSEPEERGRAKERSSPV